MRGSPIIGKESPFPLIPWYSEGPPVRAGCVGGGAHQRRGSECGLPNPQREGAACGAELRIAGVRL